MNHSKNLLTAESILLLAPISCLLLALDLKDSV